MIYPQIVGNVVIGKFKKSRFALDNEILETIELHIDKRFKDYIMSHKKHYNTETFEETFACWLNGEIHSASCGSNNINTYIPSKKRNT